MPDRAVDAHFDDNDAVDSVHYYDVGRQRYLETLQLQSDLHARVRDGRIGGAIIAVEHEPVITLGVKTSPENLLVSEKVLKEEGVELVQTDRGGDITYHGPGQLVIYPILNLRKFGSDIHRFLRLLEEGVILTLADFGLDAHRRSPAGVWIGERKVCSIGVAVRRQITYHGLALNISTNLSHFRFINPCGLTSEQIVTIEEMVQPCPPFEVVKQNVVDNIVKLFGLNIILGCGTKDD